MMIHAEEQGFLFVIAYDLHPGTCEELSKTLKETEQGQDFEAGSGQALQMFIHSLYSRTDV